MYLDTLEGALGRYGWSVEVTAVTPARLPSLASNEPAAARLLDGPSIALSLEDQLEL